MDACINHPELDAIESCEVCGQPLCGLCLWYTADGHRLCETHAQERELAGEVVLSPDTYQEALPNSLRPRAAQDEADAAQGELYEGNSYDLTSLIAAIVGLVTLGSCCGGFYCLPLVGLVLGVIAFLNADQAIDPKRTRNLAVIGMAVMGVFLLAIVGFILFYVAMFGFIIASSP